MWPLQFPSLFSQALCDLNQRSVSSLDIVIPGLNSSTDVQARISAGESIHIIRGTKGESLTRGPSPSSGGQCWAGKQNKCIWLVRGVGRNPPRRMSRVGQA